jgi:phosphinothricin acetyltransferase
VAAGPRDTLIRAAEAADAEAIARIYTQGIAERSSTFETAARTALDIEPWLLAAKGLPVLVADEDGVVLGWARIAAYSERPAYSGVGEVSVYVDAAARGRGLGRALLEALHQSARENGFHKLVGKLFTDNEASAALVKRCGWREVGLHHRHGRLDGQWRDVLVVERLL